MVVEGTVALVGPARDSVFGSGSGQEHTTCVYRVGGVHVALAIFALGFAVHTGSRLGSQCVRSTSPAGGSVPMLSGRGQKRPLSAPLFLEKSPNSL